MVVEYNKHSRLTDSVIIVFTGKSVDKETGKRFSYITIRDSITGKSIFSRKQEIPKGQTLARARDAVAQGIINLIAYKGLKELKNEGE